MSDRLKPSDIAKRSLLALGVFLNAACALHPETPLAAPSPTIPPSSEPATLPPASPTALPDVIRVTSTLMPTVILTPEASATVPPTPELVPIWAVGKGLEGRYTGIGGTETIPSIPLPDDVRIRALVEGGNQPIMDENDSIGKEITVGEIKRIEAPAIKDIAGQVGDQVVVFTRPDEYSTGVVEYTNPESDQKMVFVNWYPAFGQYAGTYRGPDGLLFATYLRSTGEPIKVTRHVFGPMPADTPVSADAGTNHVSIDGQVVVDASQPPKVEGLFSESGTMRSEHVVARVNLESMRELGINGVSLAPEKIEDLYKLILVRWAWKSAQNPRTRDARLDLFADVNQKDTAAVLVAYDQNAGLGDSGFQYDFNFGRGVSGSVGQIEISVLNPEQYSALLQDLNEKQTNYNVGKPSGVPGAIFYFENGVLRIINKERPDLKAKQLLSEYYYNLFAGAEVYGEYAIGDVFSRGSAYDSVAMVSVLDCDQCFVNKAGNNPSAFVFTLAP